MSQISLLATKNLTNEKIIPYCYDRCVICKLW